MPLSQGNQPTPKISESTGFDRQSSLTNTLSPLKSHKRNSNYTHSITSNQIDCMKSTAYTLNKIQSSDVPLQIIHDNTSSIKLEDNHLGIQRVQSIQQEDQILQQDENQSSEILENESIYAERMNEKIDDDEQINPVSYKANMFGFDKRHQEELVCNWDLSSFFVYPNLIFLFIRVQPDFQLIAVSLLESFYFIFFCVFKKKVNFSWFK